MPNPIKVRTIAEARRVIASLEAQVADLDTRIAESESVRHLAETEADAIEKSASPRG